MKKFKKKIRYIIFMLFIILAAMVPMPLVIYHKDKKPKFLIEQIDEQKDEDDTEQVAEVF